MGIRVFPQPSLPGYVLLDSGDGEKLERFGACLLRRPDPQALWPRRLESERWAAADLRFVRESDRGGRWEGGKGTKREAWGFPIRLPGLPEGVELELRATPFKHVGLFPEQAANWLWLEERRRALVAAGVERPELLNLFGYTGAASLLAVRAGWRVTHLDASRASLDWAAANLRRSGMPEDSLRWVHEDAARFVAREVRRGRRYHGILLDPPAYGRGPKGEKWLFSGGIASLLAACRELLAPDGPVALAISAYAVAYSPLAFANLFADWGASVEVGELALPEGEGAPLPAGPVLPRLLPCGLCARWWR